MYFSFLLNKKRKEINMKVEEIRMLWWMCDATRLDRFRNEYKIGCLGVTNIDRKMKRNWLRWFEHVERRNCEDIVKTIEKIRIEGNLGKLGVGQMKVIREDTRTCGVDGNIIRDRERWWGKIQVADLTCMWFSD